MADIQDSDVTVDTPEAPTSQGQIPDSAVQLDEDRYGGIGQTIQAGMEGALRGAITRPGAAALETGMGIASPAGMRAREEQHPVASGIGEAGTLVGGALAGTGEGALLGKIGEGAAELAGLGNAASRGAKIGSSIVKNAAEMAAYEAQDDIGKAILGDPNVGAESAISNIGLAAALGGAGGAIFTGAINPLWEATAGPRSAILEAIKSKANGESIISVSDSLAKDFQTVGVEPTAFQRADVSENPTAKSYIRDLTRGENETALSEKADLQSKVADSVMQPLNTSLEEMQSYDKNESGHKIKELVSEAISNKLAPVLSDLEERKAQNSVLSTNPAELNKYRDDLIERGMSNKMIGKSSKYQQYYNEAAQDLLKHETVEDLDRNISEIGRSAKNFSQDPNISLVQRDIREAIKGYREQAIRTGMDAAGPGEADKVIAKQKYTSDQYAAAERLREDLESHFNLKDSDNYRQFLKRIENDVTPEQVANKFSLKNNVDGAKFLAQEFPEVYEHVLKSERQNLLKPAIQSAAKRGDLPIDINKLNSIIKDARSGKSQYLNMVLPPEFINRAEAGARILNATTKAKDSGTPAGIMGVLRGVGTSALATVGLMTGHGPIQSVLLAELAARFGKLAPEAYKLAFLKFMASDKPVNAKGFQAAAEYFNAARKGAALTQKATQSIFKPSAMVSMSTLMPSEASTAALDRMVASNDPKTTNKQMQAQQSGLGDYMPDHQTAMTQASMRSLQYLKTLKPQLSQSTPLDTPVKPTSQQEDRYQRALQIAQQPAIVAQFIKDGTLQATDLKDLQNTSPATYKAMAEEITKHLGNARDEGDAIPYRTRLGLSLFLGQPLDSSMNPASIQAAQQSLKSQLDQQQPMQKPKKMGGKAATDANKDAKSHQTPNQAAESDRTNRD